MPTVTFTASFFFFMKSSAITSLIVKTVLDPSVLMTEAAQARFAALINIPNTAVTPSTVTRYDLDIFLSILNNWVTTTWQWHHLKHAMLQNCDITDSSDTNYRTLCIHGVILTFSDPTLKCHV